MDIADPGQAGDGLPAPDPRELANEQNGLNVAIHRVRSVISLLEDLRRTGITSYELEHAHARLVEGDLWLKRHGNAGRLGE